VTSLEDLHSLKEREVADAEERVEKALERMVKDERVGVLDLMPDDFGRMLREAGSRAYWIPPGSPEVAEERPFTNLAVLLSRPEVRGAQRILVPLNAYRSEAEFKHRYGLSEDFRITFEDFVRLVEEGRLVLTLNESPDRYSADFYKGLFKACERAWVRPTSLRPSSGHVRALHQVG
jgi:hypothetical protein